MHVEVMGWVREADDADERERLLGLAEHYRALSIESRQEKIVRVRAGLAEDVQACLNGRRDAVLDRPLGADEFERICESYAVISAAQLEQLSFGEMHDLADMMEGWAQDAKVQPIDCASCLGMADGLRELATVAGEQWSPLPDHPVGLSSFLATTMRTG